MMPAIAEKRETQQGHALALEEARTLAAALDRLHNQLDPDWDGLLDDARRLLKLLDQPTTVLVGELIPLWSASIKVGKRLLDDRALRDRSNPETTPLPKPIHDALDMAVRHVAPFIRAFPTVLARDEATGAFLRDPALFERSRNVIRGARDAGLLETNTGAGLTDAADFAAGQGPQQDKARAFTVAAGTSLVTRITGLVGAFVADPVRAGRRVLMGGIGRFLRANGEDARRLVQSQAPDLQAATTAAIETTRTNEAFAEVMERSYPVDGQREEGRPFLLGISTLGEPLVPTSTIVEPAPLTIRRDAPDLHELVLIPLIDCDLGALKDVAFRRYSGKPPPGTFTMGVSKEEDGRDGVSYDDHRPVHLVTIAKPFWLARYPLTRGEYAAFVEDTGYDQD